MRYDPFANVPDPIPPLTDEELVADAKRRGAVSPPPKPPPKPTPLSQMTADDLKRERQDAEMREIEDIRHTQYRMSRYSGYTERPALKPITFTNDPVPPFPEGDKTAHTLYPVGGRKDPGGEGPTNEQHEKMALEEYNYVRRMRGMKPVDKLPEALTPKGWWEGASDSVFNRQKVPVIRDGLHYLDMLNREKHLQLVLDAQEEGKPPPVESKQYLIDAARRDMDDAREQPFSTELMFGVTDSLAYMTEIAAGEKVFKGAVNILGKLGTRGRATEKLRKARDAFGEILKGARDSTKSRLAGTQLAQGAAGKWVTEATKLGGRAAAAGAKATGQALVRADQMVWSLPTKAAKTAVAGARVLPIKTPRILGDYIRYRTPYTLSLTEEGVLSAKLEASPAPVEALFYSVADNYAELATEMIGAHFGSPERALALQAYKTSWALRLVDNHPKFFKGLADVERALSKRHFTPGTMEMFEEAANDAAHDMVRDFFTPEMQRQIPEGLSPRDYGMVMLQGLVLMGGGYVVNRVRGVPITPDERARFADVVFRLDEVEEKPTATPKTEGKTALAPEREGPGQTVDEREFTTDQRRQHRQRAAMEDVAHKGTTPRSWAERHPAEAEKIVKKGYPSRREFEETTGFSLPTARERREFQQGVAQAIVPEYLQAHAEAENEALWEVEGDALTRDERKRTEEAADRGINLRWFDAENPAFGAPGWSDNNSSDIWVARNAASGKGTVQQSVDRVLTHEVMHKIEEKDPTGFRGLIKAVRELFPEAWDTARDGYLKSARDWDPEYAENLEKNEAELDSETAARMMEDMSLGSDLIPALIQSRKLGVLGRIRKALNLRAKEGKWAKDPVAKAWVDTLSNLLPGGKIAPAKPTPPPTTTTRTTPAHTFEGTQDLPLEPVRERGPVQEIIDQQIAPPESPERRGVGDVVRASDKPSRPNLTHQGEGTQNIDIGEPGPQGRPAFSGTPAQRTQILSEQRELDADAAALRRRANQMVGTDPEGAQRLWAEAGTKDAESFKRDAALVARPAFDEWEGKPAFQGKPYPPRVRTRGDYNKLIESVESLAREGADHRFWYDLSSAYLMEITNDDKREAEVLAALVAVFSPKNRVYPNFGQAVRAWAHYKEHGTLPEKIGVGPVTKRALQVLEGGPEGLWGEFNPDGTIKTKGPKTNSFYTNLMVGIDPTRPQGVTVDMWMMRAFGYKGDAPTAKQYKLISDEVRKISERFGWTPFQVQAAIWVPMKARWETVWPGVRKEAKAAGEYLFDPENPNKDPFPTPKIRQKWMRKAQVRAAKLAFGSVDLGDAGFNFADAAKRDLARIAVEIAPGIQFAETTNLGESYGKAVEIQKRELLFRMNRDVGQRILKQTGLLGQVDPASTPGWWVDETGTFSSEPGAGMNVVAPKDSEKRRGERVNRMRGERGLPLLSGRDLVKAGKEYTDLVDEEIRAQLTLAANTLGLAYEQDGVGWVRPSYDRPYRPGSKEKFRGVNDATPWRRSGFLLDLGQPIEKGQQNELAKVISAPLAKGEKSELLPEDSIQFFFSDSAGTVVVLNIPDALDIEAELRAENPSLSTGEGISQSRDRVKAIQTGFKRVLDKRLADNAESLGFPTDWYVQWFSGDSGYAGTSNKGQEYKDAIEAAPSIKGVGEAIDRLLGLSTSIREQWVRENFGGKPAYSRDHPLANPGDTESSRQLMRNIDAGRDETLEERDWSVKKREAHAYLDKNPEEALSRVLDSTYDLDGLDEFNTHLASELFRRKHREALVSGDPKQHETVVRIGYALRAQGTEQARALAARRDMMESPAERALKFATEAIYRPDVRTLRKIHKLQKKAGRESGEKREGTRQSIQREFRDWARKVPDVLDGMKGRGIDIGELGPRGGKGKGKGKGLTQERMGDIVKAAQDLKPHSSSDMAYEFWRNSILSDVSTQAANVIGNTAHITWGFTVERLLEGMVNLTFGKLGKTGEYLLGGKAHTSAIRAESYWMKEALKSARQPALVNFWRAMRETPGGLAFDIGVADKNKLDIVGDHAIPGMAGSIIRTPQKVLMAMDELQKTIATYMEVAALAARKSKGRGDNDVKTTRYVREVLSDYTADEWHAGYQKAVELTFQESDTVTDWVISGRKKIPGLRYVVPFVTTLWNIAKLGVRKSPLGTPKLAVDLIRWNRERARIENDDALSDEDKHKQLASLKPPRITQQWAEQILAWAATGMIYGLAGDGDGDDEQRWITGAAQAELKKEREAGYTVKQPANSIRLPGIGWVDYSRIEPWATTFGLITDLTRAYRDPDYEKKAKIAFSGVVAQMKNKTMARGIADVVSIIQSGDRITEMGAKWGGNFVSSWIPNLYRAPVRRISERDYPNRKVWGKGEQWWGMLGRSVVKRTELKIFEDYPIIDLHGEPANRHPQSTDAVAYIIEAAVRSGVLPVKVSKQVFRDDDRMMRNWWAKGGDDTLSLPSPRYTVDGVVHYMTEEQFADYQVVGQAIDPMMRMLDLDIVNPGQEDISILKSLISRTRSRARDAVLAGEPFDPEELAHEEVTAKRETAANAVTRKSNPTTIEELNRLGITTQAEAIEALTGYYDRPRVNRWRKKGSVWNRKRMALRRMTR